MIQHSIPFETLYLLSSAICMGLLATFIPPLGKRMLRLSGAYWLSTLLALVLYGFLFSLSLMVSPVFATSADLVWSAIFVLLPLNVRSWYRSINPQVVWLGLAALLGLSLLLEFWVPTGSPHFPERVVLVGVFQLLGIAWLSMEMKRFDPSLRFSQLGLIQLLTLMHALSIMIRLGYTVFLTPRPLVQDDVFMSYTLMFQGVLMLLSAMVFNNHYLETLLYAEEGQSAQIREQEQLLQAELDRTEKLRLEQSRLLLMLEHQLRNPMSVLQLTLSDPSVALEPAKRAAKSLKDMQTLLERCVFMDKLDHQAIVLNPELCNVAALLENIVQAHAQGHRVQLEASHVPFLMADMILLNIVLSNLIDNALKYSPPQAQVHVHVSHLHETDHLLQVVVSNPVKDASAMPDADKLFSKYYRSVSSQRMDGTGLGLYLVHKMLELMQASIRYAPVDNTVRFVLCFKL